MAKLDLLKELKDLYRPPSDHPVLVEVPELRFLMIDGEGDPTRRRSIGPRSRPYTGCPTRSNSR